MRTVIINTNMVQMKEITIRVAEEKLDFFYEIMNQLELDKAELPSVSKKQQKELERRIDLLKSGEMTARPWSEVKNDMLKKK